MDLNEKGTVGTEIKFNPETELERLRVDPKTKIDKPPVFCSIMNENGNKSPVLTAGNFSLCIGKAKSRKTFFLTALVPALINNSVSLSKIYGTLPADKKNVLYFDTEQSTYHLNKTVNRICEISGNEEPENLKTYGLRSLNPAQRLQVIEHGISKTQNLGVVVIDGIRDLCSIGINDEQEATALTSKFLKWTAEGEFHLALVLHQNKNDLNARGHLGTETTNKAETVFSITRDPKVKDISIVSCEYSRDIEFDPFAFTISNGLPVECDMPESASGEKQKLYADKVKDETHFEILAEIFRERKPLTYTDLWRTVKMGFANKGKNFGDNKAKDFVTYYMGQQWITRNGTGYEYKRAIF